MNTADAPSERLETVSELAVRLAERTLAKMMQHRPVDEQSVTALSEAVLLLRDYGHPVPPLALECLTHFFRERREHSAAVERGDSADQEPGPHPNEEHGETTAGGKLMGLFRSLRPGA
ncbi:hypothetical protein [Methylobacterium nigriterrae]|uniref:hypothetical protein n=1 Tax=Methylobacterium nigriterrae TaxID=3127512 RepID=UPI003013F3A0